MVTKRFSVVVADPPWRFGDSLPGGTRGASKRYRTMTAAEIAAFELPPIADDALLFMWRVSAMVEEAYRVVRAWGFVPKSEIVWSKLTARGRPHFGMGRYVRLGHESCIVAAQGRALSLIRSRSVRSVLHAPAGEHSEKPDAFFALVEELADGPYLELFGRRPREGWTVFGDEIPGGMVRG
jgi:N6-adenosine-specific RNA methylase IME4